MQRLAILFVLATSSAALAEQPRPKPAPPSTTKAKATDASVTAQRDKLAKARDELRAAIARPPEKLGADEQKRYAAMVASVREMADGADATVAKVTDGLKKTNVSRANLAELSEEQQLRIQMIMDRMNKADTAASNILKKFKEQIAQIVGNLK